MVKSLREKTSINRRYSNSSSGGYLERIVFIVAILTLVIISVVLAYMYFNLQDQSTKKEEKFSEKINVNPQSKQQPEHEALTQYLKACMNESANPCEDFWEFACGNTPGNWSLMYEVFRNLTEKKLDSPNFFTKFADSDSRILSLVAKFYNSCLSVKKRDGPNPENLPNPDPKTIRKIGGIPALNIKCDRYRCPSVETYLNYLKIVGDTFFVDFQVQQNSSDSARAYLELTVNYLQSKRLNYMPFKAAKLIFGAFEMYRNKSRDRGEELSFVNKENDRKRLIDLLINIKLDEEKFDNPAFNLKNTWPCGNISKVRMDDLYSRGGSYNWIRNLFKKYGISEQDKTAGKRNEPSVFSWLNFTSREQQVKSSIDKVYEHDALQNLLIGTYLVRYFYDEEIFVSCKQRRSESSAVVQCGQEMMRYFGWATLKMLMEEHNITETKLAKTRQIIFSVRQKFEEMLLNSSILDLDSRVSALRKLRRMTAGLISPLFLRKDKEFEKFYQHFEVDSGREFHSALQYNILKRKANEFLWNKSMEILHNNDNKKYKDTYLGWGKWLEPNAFYFPEDNEIRLLLVPSLLEPFFALSYPPEIQYGFFGALVGHEMAHGFETGNDFGGWEQDWMTGKSKDRYNRNTQCLKRQLRELQISKLEETCREKSFSRYLAETASDNIGLEVAFRAFLEAKHKAHKDKTVPSRLNISELTPEQMFFLAGAKMFCGKDSRPSYSHPPDKYRVNGKLQNSKWFSETYKCKKDDKMNPAEKCTIF